MHAARAGSPSSGARRKLEELFCLDLRSLALMRVTVAAALLIDLADRSRSWAALYTDRGVFPAEIAASLVRAPAWLSPFHLASGSALAVGGLLLLFAAAAVALLLGHRTRLACLVCWVLLTSLQARNPFVLMGGDRFLRVALFWCLFLPLGAVGSLDARGRARPASSQLLSVPGAALLTQICVMYVVTGVVKWGDTWREGSALHYALHLDYYATGFGVWLRQQSAVLPALTYAARTFEMLGPLLVFSPVATGPLRTLAVPLFVGFHLSLATALWIGFFPLFCIAVWPAVLPAWFWDRLLPRMLGRAPWPGPSAAGPPVSLAPRWLQAGVGVLLAYVLLNQAGLLLLGRDWPTRVTLPGRAVGLLQSWTMFAPDPPNADYWAVFHGRRADGGEVDPLRGSPPPRTRQELRAHLLPSERWKFFVSSVMDRPVGSLQSERLYMELTGYLCREWNATHEGGDRIVGIRVEHVRERTAPPPGGAQPPERAAVYDRDCPDAAPGAFAPG